MILVIEQYNGKYSIKACRRFESQGQEKTAYDWSFPQEYDKNKKSWGPREKAMPTSIYLGEKEQATKALLSMLDALGNSNQTINDDDIPF